MTTGGEGGMVTTNDSKLWRKIWSHKDHGKSWEAVYERQHPPGFRWLHENFGTNWRMQETQAVIGRIQLQRMPDWHTIRQAHARRIWNAARHIPGLRAPTLPRSEEHTSELQSLMRISYAVFCLKKKHKINPSTNHTM